VDFLNVGPWELVLVLLIAILVAGPKRMVEIARTMGQFSRQLRDLSREFTSALQAEVQAAEREAEATGGSLREVQRDLQDVVSGAPQRDRDVESAGAVGPGAEARPDGEEDA
jgi:Sec-independent protein translocase protein TatA